MWIIACQDVLVRNEKGYYCSKKFSGLGSLKRIERGLYFLWKWPIAHSNSVALCNCATQGRIQVWADLALASFLTANHANSAYFAAISSNFDTRPPLFANPVSGPATYSTMRNRDTMVGCGVHKTFQRIIVGL